MRSWVAKAAVKVLRPEYSSNPSVLDRFLNEARSAALIRHPGLIDIFDYGNHASGAAYIMMEFLEGESLAARVRRISALPAEMLAEIARQTAAALGAAHGQSSVHRDVKPDNIFLLPSGELPSGIRVKVLDFGIAKLSGEAAFGQSTRTGALLGTPTYMAPEQCRGSRRWGRSTWTPATTMRRSPSSRPRRGSSLPRTPSFSSARRIVGRTTETTASSMSPSRTPAASASGCCSAWAAESSRPPNSRHSRGGASRDRSSHRLSDRRRAPLARPRNPPLQARTGSDNAAHRPVRAPGRPLAMLPPEAALRSS
ncbi:MAG: serine/threonine protein kinase [Myxococcales bacterium]|nr:serine/threonine protein kinase [Myxococcales bacterium]